MTAVRDRDWTVTAVRGRDWTVTAVRDRDWTPIDSQSTLGRIPPRPVDGPGRDSSSTAEARSLDGDSFKPLARLILFNESVE